MGGSGSGRRWHPGSRDTTENSHAIDVRIWHRDGWLKPGSQFVVEWLHGGKEAGSIGVLVHGGWVELIYRFRAGGGTWTDQRHRVVLEWTSCNLGGQRPWFCCPTRGCRRRAAILYCNGQFACRRCCGLVYQSQRESPADRAARKANRIRNKLGWQPGFFSPKGGKPNGMY